MSNLRNYYFLTINVLNNQCSALVQEMALANGKKQFLNSMLFKFNKLIWFNPDLAQHIPYRHLSQWHLCWNHCWWCIDYMQSIRIFENIMLVEIIINQYWFAKMTQAHLAWLHLVKYTKVPASTAGWPQISSVLNWQVKQTKAGHEGCDCLCFMMSCSREHRIMF